MRPTRRALGLGLLLAGAAAQDRAYAAALETLEGRPVARDRLWLRRPDGSEIVSRFRSDGGYEDGQVLLLSWFLRDLQDSGRAVWMEPRLLDLLAAVQTSMSSIHGAALPLMVTSGYRTRAHNAAIESAARNSMHLYGYAADVQAPGYPPRALALAASFFAEGGVGLYDRFTHLDVWRRRVWIGGRGASGRAGTAAPAPAP